MKTLSFFFLVMMLWSQSYSQKNMSIQASNLNMSKSNINRLVYSSGMVSAANADLILAELEKMAPMDEETLKMWLPANFKRFGIEPTLVSQITIFSARQYADCTVCKKHCKGRCVQDPGADCICMYHSEPNLRMGASEKPLTIIFLSGQTIDEATALELVSNTISSSKRATTVKSSKSNSSE